MSKDKLPDKDPQFGSPAYHVADRLAGDYGLSYRCKVNLEGAAAELILLGMTEDEAFALLDDVVDNIEFIDEKPAKRESGPIPITDAPDTLEADI